MMLLVTYLGGRKRCGHIPLCFFWPSDEAQSVFMCVCALLKNTLVYRALEYNAELAT